MPTPRTRHPTDDRNPSPPCVTSVIFDCVTPFDLCGMITKERYYKGLTYAAYRARVAEEFEQGRVTGNEQTEARLGFTKLNMHRMDRWDRTFAPDPATMACIAGTEGRFHWLVLAEGWCGDAAQNLPIIARLAEASPDIDLRILLRDENLDVMDRFLTNGGRAIPKLIVLDSDFRPIDQWGPRPKEIQDQVTANKQSGALTKEEMDVQIHTWYAHNRGVALQKEIREMMCRLVPASDRA